MYRILLITALLAVAFVSITSPTPAHIVSQTQIGTPTETPPPTLPPACAYVPRVPCLTPGPVTPGPDIPPTLEPARPARRLVHLPLVRR